MAGRTIHLFGAFSFEHGSGGESPAIGQKAHELLCYLLLHRDRPLPRTALADVFWSEHDAAHGLKQLRQALWQLHAVDDPASSASSLFDSSPRTVTLHTRAIAWLDIAEFETAFGQVRGPASRLLTPSEADIADRAVALYRGDLLEGYDYEWCVVEREYLRSAYLTMLDRLMLYCERTGEYALGIDYGERILRVDRAREYTHRRMMYQHALLGNRTGAIRQYERCGLALREELDVLPARATTRLHEMIRSGAELPERAPHHEADFSPAIPARDSAPLERLRGIQRTLIELQSQIQLELGAAEH